MSVETMKRSGVYHLLPKCHAYIKVRMKFSESEHSLHLVLELFLHKMFELEVYKPVIQH